MSKQGVEPDELSRPFWQAANANKLVIQNCQQCDRLQHPPLRKCTACGATEHLEWKPMSGRGQIYNYAVVHDGPIKSLHEDQPFNVAVITLEEDSGIQMYSHLPGTPVDEVPIHGNVEVIFQATDNGQKVPEWRVVD
ncbi:MAG: OB-fold domain-containing protein [Pseudomonadales bacterium]|nr:OB-fold domain-containing protein [Pseudomonadales bacterium]